MGLVPLGFGICLGQVGVLLFFVRGNAHTTQHAHTLAGVHFIYYSVLSSKNTVIKVLWDIKIISLGFVSPVELYQALWY